MTKCEIDNFYQQLFETTLMNWEEKFDEIDDLMLHFPYGKMYKQINDGRYHQMLQFLRDRLSSDRFQQLGQKLYHNFLNELVEFDRTFDDFIKNRDEYQKQNQSRFEFFNGYNFKINDWLEELAENFMHVILPYVDISRLCPPVSHTLLETLFLLYESHAELNIQNDLTDMNHDHEIGVVLHCRPDFEIFCRFQKIF